MAPRRRASDLDADEMVELRDLLEEARANSVAWHKQLKNAGQEERSGRSIGLHIGRLLNVHVKTRQAITATTLAGVLLSAATYVWPDKFALKKKEPVVEVGSPAWTDKVDSHVKKGEVALSEFEAVKSQVSTLRAEQSNMRVELIDMRIDSLEQWEWQTEREGDPVRRDELRKKIAALRRKLVETARP